MKEWANPSRVGDDKESTRITSGLKCQKMDSLPIKTVETSNAREANVDHPQSNQSYNNLYVSSPEQLSHFSRLVAQFNMQTTEFSPQQIDSFNQMLMFDLNTLRSETKKVEAWLLFLNENGVKFYFQIDKDKYTQRLANLKKSITTLELCQLILILQSEMNVYRSQEVLATTTQEFTASIQHSVSQHNLFGIFQQQRRQQQQTEEQALEQSLMEAILNLYANVNNAQFDSRHIDSNMKSTNRKLSL